MVTGGGSWGQEESKYHSYLQEGQKGRSRELQASQPHLSPWEGDGANLSENHFQAQESK